MRSSLLVVGLICGLSAVARGQESLDFVSADRETAVQLTRILESVKAANLPTEPVIAKARLAMQVKAPPARLVAVLQAVASRLEEARSALGAGSPKADIVAGQDALSTKGVTKEMLHQLRETQPRGSVAVAIGVMQQLVASGVEPKQATEIVSALVRGRATNAQLVALGNNVSQDVIGGAGASSALQIRLETLKPLLAYGTGAAGAAAAANVDGFTTHSGTSANGPGKGPTNPRGRP
jgi:hypothetical protein